LYDIPSTVKLIPGGLVAKETVGGFLTGETVTGALAVTEPALLLAVRV